LRKALPLPCRVLEIGTGKGGFLRPTGETCGSITTLDIDADQQRAGEHHVRQAGPRCPIRYVIHDGSSCLGPMPVFDSVVQREYFSPSGAPDVGLSEMLRVLKPGGKLVLCDFLAARLSDFDRIFSGLKAERIPA